ncbi:hypothetical protein CERZMDRAFT_84753 [Cercospora zeae-maydis SCOH1-5]|uniref:Uncharacterized protein n=1 Tax=Cercospora zeae-maydis SCOH1-5 TaxID=717836 RepID=A0A6A6FG04_9PEZI|nr:hypothetical protein CERZMDRAFT_84753 [Cercospora zeae-maydis SCOH1-5]
MPGRGGAGNWQAQQAQSHPKQEEDLEAQKSSPSTETPVAGPSTPRADQQYAFSGRGGSGNSYNPKELHRKGTCQNADLSHTSAADAAAGWSSTLSGVQTKGSDLVRAAGRGGSGNMIYGVTDDERAAIRKMQEEEEAKKIAASVEASVNATLAEPPKAKLADAYP